MKIPSRLQPLVDDGLIDRVLRQLMSGKEAAVYVVECGGDASGRGAETRCAKVYKDAQQRSFRQAVDYTENRKTKNSRQARAMSKGTAFGRKAREAAWQSAEVDALYRLAAAGVRVPQPYNFLEGVLLMELVVDADGNAAPRLNDVAFEPDEARRHHRTLLDEVIRMLMAGVIHGDLSEFNILVAADGNAAPRLNDVAFEPDEARRHHRTLLDEVIRMLMAGVIHGDLSEFNILVAADGPVIIDLPQAVDAAGNNHAKAMLERDVTNLANYFGRFAPELIGSDYGKELWALYEGGLLQVGMPLTGRVAAPRGAVDVGGLMDEIEDVRLEEEARQRRIGEAAR